MKSAEKGHSGSYRWAFGAAMRAALAAWLMDKPERREPR